MISQTDKHRNFRSTVGALTYICTNLRVMHEKLHRWACSHCDEAIYAADCEETLVKWGGDECTVFMRCQRCGHQIVKLARTHFFP